MNNLTDAEIIVELNKLIDMGHRAVEQCLVQLEHMEQDAAIGRLVRAKFTSGNSISVPRITLDRKEVFKDER